MLGVGGKYAGVQAAGGAVSVEKGVELTSVRAADGGQVRAFGGHTLKLGRGRSEFKGANGSAGGDVEVAGVSGEGAERVQREAAALRALNGSEASKASMAARAKEVHGDEHVGGDADVDELVGLLAEYSELEAALEQGGVVKRADGGRRLLSDVESDVDGALRGMNVSLYENRSVVERMRGLRDLRLARRAVCSGVVCGAKPGVCRAGEEGEGCCPCRRADADGARCARVRCRAERVCRGGENASACCPCARMPSRSEVDAAVQRMNGSSGVHVADVDVGEGHDGDVAVAAALGAAVAEAEAREARESVLSSDGEVEFDSGAEVDLAGPVKVKRAVSKGGSVARVRGELRVADGYEEEEVAMSEGGEDACLLYTSPSPRDRG